AERRNRVQLFCFSGTPANNRKDGLDRRGAPAFLFIRGKQANEPVVVEIPLYVNQFVLKQPDISGFDPKEGTAGTEVFVTGSNLDSVSLVSFGDAAAKFTIGSPELLVAVVPEGARTGKTKISVRTGTVSIPNPFLFRLKVSDDDFEVMQNQKKRIRGFSPDAGPPGTQTVLSVMDPADVAEILIGEMTVPFRVDPTNSSVVLVIPPDAISGPISMITTDGEGFTSDGAFTVTSP